MTLNTVLCTVLFAVGDELGNQLTKIIDAKIFNSYCNIVGSGQEIHASNVFRGLDKIKEITSSLNFLLTITNLYTGRY